MESNQDLIKALNEAIKLLTDASDNKESTDVADNALSRLKDIAEQIDIGEQIKAQPVPQLKNVLVMLDAARKRLEPTVQRVKDRDRGELKDEISNILASAKKMNTVKEKMEYAISLIENIPGITSDKVDIRIAIAAYFLDETREDIKKIIARAKGSKNACVETAEEFKEKYGRKRFNSSNAGKSLIYSYLYWGYLKNEGMSNDELLKNPLYKDINEIRAKVTNVDDAYIYNQYLRLEEWVGSAFETALFMRNATKSVLSHFHNIVTDVIYGESLREALGAKADEASISIWLSNMSIDSIRPTESSYQTVLNLRENIEYGLRYLNVYNTLIALIAKEIEIPELVLFQVNMRVINDGIGQLNDVLTCLREDIGKREIVSDEQTETAYAPKLTQKVYEVMLEAFRNVSPDAPPIPAANIKATEYAIIDTVCVKGKAWTNLFLVLCRNYWRR